MRENMHKVSAIIFCNALANLSDQMQWLAIPNTFIALREVLESNNALKNEYWTESYPSFPHFPRQMLGYHFKIGHDRVSILPINHSQAFYHSMQHNTYR
jgi:hypothetical protein